MPSDYRDILGDVEIEEPPGVFLPMFTHEMSDWLSEASSSIGNALGGGRVSRRTYLLIQRVVIAVALFAPSDVLLPDGRQRATFSVRQMAEAVGASSNSTKKVQQALRVLCLETSGRDAATYRRAYELLKSERDGQPLLASLYKSDSRKLSSAWELCGIRPRPLINRTDEETVGHQQQTVTPNDLSVGLDSQTVTENDRTVADLLDPESATVDWRQQHEQLGSSVGTCNNEAGCIGNPATTVANASQTCNQLSTTLNSYAPNPSSSERADDWYERLKQLFPHRPGEKETETRSAFDRLVSRGYEPAKLYNGARSYVNSAPIVERARFPLTFLRNTELVRAWCGKPPRLLDQRKLAKMDGGYWTYEFGQGIGFVDCPPTATREEAFEAVRRMVSDGLRRP